MIGPTTAGVTARQIRTQEQPHEIDFMHILRQRAQLNLVCRNKKGEKYVHVLLVSLIFGAVEPGLEAGSDKDADFR